MNASSCPQAGLEFYLEEVLGVKSVITPKSVIMQAQQIGSAVEAELIENPYSVIGDQPQVLLWTAKIPTDNESALMNKMMAAAKITSYITFWGVHISQLPENYFDGGLHFGLKFFGTAELKEKVSPQFTLTHTSKLSSMLEGASPEIQSHKKKVWGQIQEIIQSLMNA